MSLQPAFRRGIFLVLLLVTLSFGWWPYSFRMKNDVKWDPALKAIRFNQGYEEGDSSTRGTAFSLEALDTREWEGVTLEVEVRGRPRGNGLGVFLEFEAIDGSSEPELFFAQWREHLVVMSKEWQEDGTLGYSEIGYKKFFAGNEFSTFVLNSQNGRTSFYVDGDLMEARSRFSLIGPSNDFQGRFSLGSSFDGSSPFLGEIRRLAIFDRGLSPKTDASRVTEPVLAIDGEDLAAKGPGAMEEIRNALDVPVRYRPASRAFFGPVREAFEIDSSALASDVIVNALGFIPVGLCFAAMLRRRLNSWLAVACGVALASFGLSFLIEWGQGYLVHRDSSQLDVILNTFSGTLAVLVPRRLVLFL